MTININIDCEDDRELLMHLTVIRQQIKKALKKNPNANNIEVEDNNCYGTHEVTIKERFT